MRKPLATILDELDETFKKAEEELISNDWSVGEISARQQIFVELIDMFGTWEKKADCIQPIIDSWYKERYLPAYLGTNKPTT